MTTYEHRDLFQRPHNNHIIFPDEWNGLQLTNRTLPDNLDKKKEKSEMENNPFKYGSGVIPVFFKDDKVKFYIGETLYQGKIFNETTKDNNYTIKYPLLDPKQTIIKYAREIQDISRGGKSKKHRRRMNKRSKKHRKQTKKGFRRIRKKQTKRKN